MSEMTTHGLDTRTPQPIDAHTVARLLYLVSLLLLLAGAWVLIDPFNRLAGETTQIWITVVAFEAYVWLLLLLGRWQRRTGLAADAGRSGVLATVLVGLLFMTFNEMHRAAAAEGYWVAAIAVLLGWVKLAVGPRWVGVDVPRPLRGLAGAWLIVLAAPGMALNAVYTAASPNVGTMHAAAYGACWLAALVATAHVPLAAWQSRGGWARPAEAIGSWWAGWLLSAILGLLSVVQLYATMWSFYVEWAAWYFSPIWLAVAVVAACLAAGRGRGAAVAWSLMAAAVVYAGLAALTNAPEGLSAAAWAASVPVLAHPTHLAGLFMSLLLGAAALLMSRTWLFGPAFIYPLVYDAIEGVRSLLRFRYGKGVALLTAAFVLLAAGAALQWWRERTRPDADTAGMENADVATLASEVDPPGRPARRE